MKTSAVFFIVFLVASCAGHRSIQDGQTIRFDNHKIRYGGRVALKGNATEFYWPGTSATIRFKGTGATATLSDYNGQNYFAVVVDGKYRGKLRVDSTRKEYVLTQNLPYGEHEVEIFKTTQVNKEYNRGFIRLYGFSFQGNVIRPKPTPTRRIEFYGNSITCGHAVEDSSGKDSGAPQFENNYFSYGAITARHFNAQYSCIAVSGIGLFSGFRSFTMPEIYDLRNPLDKRDSWDFSQYQPDIVVVNLLQNDEAVVSRPASEQFKKLFGTKPPDENFIIEKYAGFIKSLRDRYPNTHIICVLGNMAITKDGSEWPRYVEKAVKSLNDKKNHTYFFKFKGTPGHPNIREQRAMANELIKFINEVGIW